MRSDGAVCVATLAQGGITHARPDVRAETIAQPLPDPYTDPCSLGRNAFITLSGRGVLLRAGWDAKGQPI